MLLDLGTLGVKVRADGTEETSRKLDGLKSAISGIKKAATVAVAGITAAGAAITAVSTKAIQAYGDYEQLVGGVETLFKDSAGIIEDYANQAYMTSGLSANDYMETITGFSASLLQSLGNDTKKAAEYGNQAVIDMSDNANKMGTSMEMIQNAYQGFAKQNYTMLDNLKLGYGGTKTEMERLLKDAQKISGVKYDISSFADITQAIHVIQTEMGITGTTAKEAMSTIQGSFNMMKSSWTNLMTAMTDPNQDLSAIINNLFTSVVAFGNNLMPRIQNAMQGIASALEQFTPLIIEKIPTIIDMLTPSITTGISSLLSTVTSLLSSFIPMLLNMVGQLAPTITDIVMNIADVIIQSLPMLLNAGIQLIIALGQGLIQGLPQMIPQIIDVVLALVDTLLDNIDMIIDTAVDLIMALADGLIKAIPILIEKAPDIVIKLTQAIIRNSGRLVDAAFELIKKLAKGLISNIPTLVKNIPKIITAIISAFTVGYKSMETVGVHLLQGLWNGISDTIGWLKEKVRGVVEKIKTWFTGKEGFDEHSPSKWAYQVAAYLMQGLANGVADDMTAEEALKKKCDNLKAILKEFTSSYDIDKKVASAEYDLWLSNNPNATDKDKDRKQLEMLTEQSNAQLQSVLSINNAYKEQCELTGENSDEAKSLKLELLQAAEAFNKLNNEINQLKNKKDDDGTYFGFNSVDELNQMLKNKENYEQYLSKNKYSLSKMGMSDEDIKAVARKQSGYDGVTVYQNFYTKTASPSEVYNATKKATNDMEVISKL